MATTKQRVAIFPRGLIGKINNYIKAFHTRREASEEFAQFGVTYDLLFGIQERGLTHEEGDVKRVTFIERDKTKDTDQ